MPSEWYSREVKRIAESGGVQARFILTAENHAYLKRMAAVNEKTMVSYLNVLIEDHRAAHAEEWELIKGIAAGAQKCDI